VAQTDRGTVFITTTTWATAAEILAGLGYVVHDLRGVVPVNQDKWTNVISTGPVDEDDDYDK
jgi:hypothetical protein